MATLIITEKASQAKDLRAAFGARFGQILPAEGHLLRLAEPEEVNAAWKSWSCVVLKPNGLYPTRPVAEGKGRCARQWKRASMRAFGEALALGAGQSSSAPAWEGASRSKTLATMSVV
jgi:DNA topoisomerase-3